jgi:phenylalanyl-tRNA synthetase alpha chain
MSSQNNITIESPDESKLLGVIKSRNDTEAKRLLRYFDMPDLTKSEKSPLNELIKRVSAIQDFADFDIVRVPEIVPASASFDLFDFPPDHPARSRSDTYYIDDENILRTHTTVMWYYYLPSEQVKEKLAGTDPIGVFSYGKVYRKDEIDRHHMNVFHQIDGLYLCRKEERNIERKDLEEVLVKIAKAVFGEDIKYRFNDDSFPYTYSSIEMEIQKGEKWVEVLGAGIAQPSVLEKLGVDSKVWGGWAFGFGLERLAIISMELPDIRLLWSNDARVTKQLKLGNKFEPVSKFPPITRDISFVVGNDFVPNNYFDLIRDIGGDLVEEVEQVDKYENKEKFGEGKTSYTYRIIYRSNDRTLISEEVDKIQNEIYKETEKQFRADIR